MPLSSKKAAEIDPSTPPATQPERSKAGKAGAEKKKGPSRPLTEVDYPHYIKIMTIGDKEKKYQSNATVNAFRQFVSKHDYQAAATALIGKVLVRLQHEVQAQALVHASGDPSSLDLARPSVHAKHLDAALAQYFGPKKFAKCLQYMQERQDEFEASYPTKSAAADVE